MKWPIGPFRNGHSPGRLNRVFEQWLRNLRDLNEGVDFAEQFSPEPESNLIRFYHPSLSPSQREIFIGCINNLIAECKELKVVVQRDNGYGLLQDGCSFALRFKKLSHWRPPPIPPNESIKLEQQLYCYGRLIAETLYHNLSHPADENPIGWRVVPVVELSSVWVHIWPTIDNYPSLRPEHSGWMQDDIAIIQDEFPNPNFRVARFVQQGNEVQILFDFLEAKQ